MNKPKGSYSVTINRERNNRGSWWVARNRDGVWVTYGKIDRERTDEEIVYYLFHREEVEKIERSEGVLTAWIYTY
jgi:hypothetical protein